VAGNKDYLVMGRESGEIFHGCSFVAQLKGRNRPGSFCDPFQVVVKFEGSIWSFANPDGQAGSSFNQTSARGTP
jgi:hypothetical protein